jgi:uncharacterized membrane protein YhaH (DUF805 family)
VANFIKTYFWKIVKFHYTDYKDRAYVKQFWYFILIVFVFFVILNFTNVGLIAGFISRLLRLMLFSPLISITTRRLHDVNISGWVQLIYFIPAIGWIILIVLLSLPSVEPNKFDKKGGVIAKKKEKIQEKKVVSAGLE